MTSLRFIMQAWKFTIRNVLDGVRRVKRAREIAKGRKENIDLTRLDETNPKGREKCAKSIDKVWWMDVAINQMRNAKAKVEFILAIFTIQWAQFSFRFRAQQVHCGDGPCDGAMHSSGNGETAQEKRENHLFSRFAFDWSVKVSFAFCTISINSLLSFTTKGAGAAWSVNSFNESAQKEKNLNSFVIVS